MVAYCAGGRKTQADDEEGYDFFGFLFATATTEVTRKAAATPAKIKSPMSWIFDIARHPQNETRFCNVKARFYQKTATLATCFGVLRPQRQWLDGQAFVR